MSTSRMTSTPEGDQRAPQTSPATREPITSLSTLRKQTEFHIRLLEEKITNLRDEVQEPDVVNRAIRNYKQICDVHGIEPLPDRHLCRDDMKELLRPYCNMFVDVMNGNFRAKKYKHIIRQINSRMPSNKPVLSHYWPNSPQKSDVIAANRKKMITAWPYGSAPMLAYLRAQGREDLANEALEELKSTGNVDGDVWDVGKSSLSRPACGSGDNYVGGTARSVTLRESEHVNGYCARGIQRYMNTTGAQFDLYAFIHLTFPLEDILDIRKNPLYSFFEVFLFSISLPSLNRQYWGLNSILVAPQMLAVHYKRIGTILFTQPINHDLQSAEALRQKVRIVVKAGLDQLLDLVKTGIIVADNPPDDVVAGVLEESADNAECFYGHLPTVYCMKDAPGEQLIGNISGGIFTDEMGPALSLAWYTLRDASGSDDRCTFSTWLDLFQILPCKTWPTLHAWLLRRTISSINPVHLVLFGKDVLSVFTQPPNVILKLEKKEIDYVKPAIVERNKERLKQALPDILHCMNDQAGTIQIVSTGNSPEHLSLATVAPHPGGTFHDSNTTAADFQIFSSSIRLALTVDRELKRYITEHNLTTTDFDKDRRQHLEVIKQRAEHEVAGMGLTGLIDEGKEELSEVNRLRRAISTLHVIDGVRQCSCKCCGLLHPVDITECPLGDHPCHRCKDPKSLHKNSQYRRCPVWLANACDRCGSDDHSNADYWSCHEWLDMPCTNDKCTMKGPHN